MSSAMEALLLRGEAANCDQSLQLLTAPEAERMIQQLAPLPIEEVGSARYLAQHDWIEKLNMQAHCNAQSHSDEFVMEYLVSYDKVTTLIHDLLVIEAWKERAYPLLQQHLAQHVDQVVSYLLLYHESAVANLLEVVLFHQQACEAASDDALLELADWCYRKLHYLNTDALKDAQHKERSAQQLLALAPAEELEDKRAEAQLGAGLCALTILRYLTDYLPQLPLAVLNRVVASNDTVMALVPLLDSPPWQRSRGGKLERYSGSKWQPVPASERLRLCQQEAQVWLALNNLLVEPTCRAKYDLDDLRKERLQRLRRQLHEVLLDQLPLLRDLQRVLDEVALGVGPAPEAAKAGRLILEQVPELRDSILRGRDWAALAEQQCKTHFGPGARALARERMQSLVQAFDFLAQLEPQERDQDKQHKRAAGGKDPAAEPIRVTCSRRVQDGMWEHWCEFELQAAGDKPPEPVSLQSGDGSQEVQGLRHRLQPLELHATRPLPANGKIVVRHGGQRAEALLQLPALPVRSSSEGPAALWLTVGLLAADALTLQLRLKKNDKPTERDKAEGVWYAYHPVGGAITLLKQD